MSTDRLLFAVKVIGALSICIALIYVAFRKPSGDNSTGDYRDDI